MTDDEIIELGQYSEDLLSNYQFNNLAVHFEQSVIRDMLRTEAHELKKREGIYASFLGFKEFLECARAVIAAKDKLVAPPIPVLDEHVPIPAEPEDQ
jgi:hypothetical protein